MADPGDQADLGRVLAHPFHRRWGWPVEVFRLGALAGTSFSGRMAQRSVIKRLGEMV